MFVNFFFLRNPELEENGILFTGYFFKMELWGWKDSSGVKSTGCSFRGPGFKSQHPRQLATVC